MPIPLKYVEDGLKLADGMRLFGEPVKMLTRDELIACVAQFANSQRERNAQDRQRAMDILASTPFIE